MLANTLGGSLLGNILASKVAVRCDDGVIREVHGTKRGGQDT